MLTLHTDLGDIRIELDDEHAPVTAAHVRHLLTDQVLDAGCFYRAVREEHSTPGREFQVLQGGWPERAPWLPTVPHEGTRPHHLGAVSLARLAPGTATSEFFICLDAEAPALDAGAPEPMDGHGFAVFGHVVTGLDVVRRIHGAPTQPDAPHPLMRGQLLTKPVAFRAAFTPT